MVRRICFGFLILGFLFGNSGTEAQTRCARATNKSTQTQCAEQDNINIPLFGRVSSFVIEATHPTYPVGTDSCAADFRNCPPPETSFSFPPFPAPCTPFDDWGESVCKLFDDGDTVVEAVRLRSWWRPNGMAVSVDTGASVNDAHYIRVSRKIVGANEWPQFFVLYMDGNLRLIPHPPVGSMSVCFGSSVIVGPAPPAVRPIAEITSARYVSTSKTMEVRYKTGDSAVLSLSEVDRTLARVRVTVNYPTDRQQFATFRSMFIAEGNADVDRVLWRDISGILRDEEIVGFRGGEGTEGFFYRRTRSQHNTSGPDIRIMFLDSVCQTATTKIGAFGSGFWYLDINDNGIFDAGDRFSSWGSAGSIPVVGDWNGDGRTKIGAFGGGFFYLDSNGNGIFDAQDKVIGWGRSTSTPVVGDWNGDGKTKIGIFDGGFWYLDSNGNGSLDGTDCFAHWGDASSIPVVGDWNGDGRTKIGAFGGGFFYLDYNGNCVFDIQDKVIGWGGSTSTPVVGDWNGDGKTKVGIFEGGFWYLDTNGNGLWDTGDLFAHYGTAGSTPILGDWNGDSKTKIGAYGSGYWFLDANGNGVFDGADRIFRFGPPASISVVGRW